MKRRQIRWRSRVKHLDCRYSKLYVSSLTSPQTLVDDIDDLPKDNAVAPADLRVAAVQLMSEEEFTSIEEKLKRKLNVQYVTMLMSIYVLNHLARVCPRCCLDDG